MRADRQPACRVALRAGDCFAFDSAGYPDGDIMFVEVLEVIARFSRDTERVGASTGGYRVAVYSADAGFVEDYYGWDFVDDHGVRLSAAEMMSARGAGWPSTHVRFREILGDALPLKDSRGVPVRSLRELRLAASRQCGRY